MSSAIGSAAAISGQPGPNQQGNAYAELSSNEFLQIILSELTNQDPLAPSDTTAILEQLSSIRNIESQTTLESKFEALVTQNAISTSANMIGKYVQGINAANNSVAGIVTSLSIEEGKPVLRLSDGSSLPADRVTQVEDGDASGFGQLLGGIDPESLLGMLVAGQGANGQSITGVVTGIRFDAGVPFFELDTGLTMPFAGLQAVRPLTDSDAG